MVRAAKSTRNKASRAGRNVRSEKTEIVDDKLYFVSDLVQILNVCRQTIVRYKRSKGLPLSGASRGAILGSDLKSWLRTFSA